MIDFVSRPGLVTILLYVLLPVPVVLTVVFSVLPVADGRSTAPAVGAVALGAVVTALFFRHALAATRRERPRAWRWTFTALCLCVYVPAPLLDWWSWPILGVVVSTTCLMSFRGRARIVAVTGSLLYHPANEIYLWLDAVDDQWDAGLAFWMISSVDDAGVLPFLSYTAILLVRRIDDLLVARAEHADEAVRGERLRLSRDLHDMLGHSLTAISAKGQLAQRVLAHDARGALGQLADVTTITDDTQRGVRAVTTARYPLSLRDEVARFQRLLTDAHVACDIHVDGAVVARSIEDVLAWAVREAVTNILRHADATTTSIVLSRADGTVDLRITNDGSRVSAPWGTGLTGIAQRAAEHGGALDAGRGPAGTFRLHLKLPAVT